MGLDTVEIVITIEEEFDIEIPDEDAANLGILGDLHDYVVRVLRQRGETPDESRVWSRIAEIVIAQLGVHPKKVTRSADIVRDLGAD